MIDEHWVVALDTFRGGWDYPKCLFIQSHKAKDGCSLGGNNVISKHPTLKNSEHV